MRQQSSLVAGQIGTPPKVANLPRKYYKPKYRYEICYPCHWYEIYIVEGVANSREALEKFNRMLKSYSLEGMKYSEPANPGATKIKVRRLK